MIESYAKKLSKFIIEGLCEKVIYRIFDTFAQQFLEKQKSSQDTINTII